MKINEKTKSIEIYFEDLNEKAQEELLKIYGVETPSEMNWEIVPIFVLSLPEA